MEDPIDGMFKGNQLHIFPYIPIFFYPSVIPVSPVIINVNPQMVKILLTQGAMGLTPNFQKCCPPISKQCLINIEELLDISCLVGTIELKLKYSFCLNQAGINENFLNAVSLAYLFLYNLI